MSNYHIVGKHMLRLKFIIKPTNNATFIQGLHCFLRQNRSSEIDYLNRGTYMSASCFIEFTKRVGEKK